MRKQHSKLDVARDRGRTAPRLSGKAARRACAAAAAAGLFPLAASAQEVVAAQASPVLGGSQFLVAVVAGIVLAAAFTTVLTCLSVAAGLNVAGRATSPEDSRGSSPQGGSSSLQGRARTVGLGFSLWALFTSSISLFFASWLAVRLAQAPTETAGALLGLVIWGVFFVAFMVFEAGAVTAMVGAIAGIVTGMLRSSYGAASNLFRRSPAEEASEAAARIAESVREEFFGSREEFHQRLEQYMRQLKPTQSSPEDIAKGILQALDESEIKLVASPENQEATIMFLQGSGAMSREQARTVARKMQDAASIAREEYSSPKSTAEKAADAALRLAGISQQEAESYRHKLEDYLRSTGKAELNPEGIKHDIEELIKSPKSGAEALRARASSIDKSTLTAVLSQRKDMSPEEARRVVDRVNAVLEEISGKAAGKQSAGSGMERARSKIRAYLDSLRGPEARYEGVARDLQKLLYDPKEGVSALTDRLRSMNRDTFKRLLASRKDISEEDAEHIVRKMESTRDELMQRAERMRDEVQRRLHEAKQASVRQMDEARKTAAAAAWWLVAIAVASGAAAVLGGMAGVPAIFGA